MISQTVSFAMEATLFAMEAASFVMGEFGCRLQASAFDRGRADVPPSLQQTMTYPTALFVMEASSSLTGQHKPVLRPPRRSCKTSRNGSAAVMQGLMRMQARRLTASIGEERATTPKRSVIVSGGADQSVADRGVANVTKIE